MANIPSGTVTFLFTDIEGSTKLAQEHSHEMPALLARHNEILNQATEKHNGYVFNIVGDSFAVAFHSASDALNAAMDAQRALQSEPWKPAPVKVRMGIHTGEAQLDDEQNEPHYSGYATLALTQRIMSAGHGGQTLISQSVHGSLSNNIFETIHLKDMGVHRLKGFTQLAHLYQINAFELETEFPSLNTLDVSPNNLPVQLNKFIGREKEMAAINELLSTSRLITLTGSGGAGKTRLSIEVAERLQHVHPHGVWFVELAPQTDPDAISRTVALVLGLQPSGEVPIEIQLTSYLKNRTLLLVFDNCEHLIQACAQLAKTLLQQCPKLKILASSREALSVPGETAYRVPSLDVPDPDSLNHLEEFEAVEAIQLFVERAKAAKESFALTPENAATVAHICQRLDGIPLAIELAAARVRVMMVDQISKRLDDRFRLLTGGSRTALPRQQTLRALIDWSYGLLSEPEKSLLRRLSVFVGGFTMEAAEAVCVGNDIESYEILDLLTSLVDKSLVNTQETEIGIRYNRLETIRQYAREKFLDSDEVIPMRDAHLAYFMDVAETAGKEIRDKHQVLWVKRLDADQENINAAITWATDTNVPDGLRLVNGLEHYLFIRYDPLVGSRWLLGLLEKADDTLDPAVHATALRNGMAFLWENGDAEKKERYLNKSLALFKSIHDEAGAAFAMCHKAWTHQDRGELAEAENIFQASLEVFERTGYPWGAWMVQSQLAISIYGTSNPALARRYAEKSLAQVENTGDITSEQESLALLSTLAYNRGEDFEAAFDYLERSDQLRQKLYPQRPSHYYYQKARLHLAQGDYEAARKCYLKAIEGEELTGGFRNKIWALLMLGRVEVRLGDLEQAHRKFIDNFASFEKLGHKIGFVLTAEGFSELAMALNLPEPAAVLIAWAGAKRIEIGDHRPVPEQRMMDDLWSKIEAQMSPQVIAEAKAKGEKMSYEETVEYATREIKP